MSRAFHPPDTLSKDDIRTIADVRREIWTNSMKGLGIGTLTGFVAYSIASIGQHRLKLWNLSSTVLNRNTAFLSVLLGGALGSFIMSVTTGKNQVHNLHPIFEIGARNTNIPEKEDETISTHLSLKELSILQEKEQQSQEPSRISSSNQHDHQTKEMILDPTKLEQNRLYRRATITKKMQVHGGASTVQPPITSPTVDGQLLSDQEASKAVTAQQSR
jgi:hypothetical protein